MVGERSYSNLAFLVPSSYTLNFTDKSIVKAIVDGDVALSGCSFIMSPFWMNLATPRKVTIQKSGLLTDMPSVSYSKGWQIKFDDDNLKYTWDIYGNATLDVVDEKLFTIEDEDSESYPTTYYYFTKYKSDLKTCHSKSIFKYFNDPSKTTGTTVETDFAVPYRGAYITPLVQSNASFLIKYKIMVCDLTDWFGNKLHLYNDLAYYTETPTYNAVSNALAHDGIVFYNNCYYRMVDSGDVYYNPTDRNIQQDAYLKQFNVKYPYYHDGTFIQDRTITVNSGLNADVGDGKAIDVGTLTGLEYHGWRIKYDDAGTTKYLPSDTTWYSPTDKSRIYADCEIILYLEETTYTVPFYSQGHLDHTLSGSRSHPITLPDPITKPSGRLSFLGWYDAEVGGNPIGMPGESWQPTSNNPVYAHWETTYIAGFKWKLKEGTQYKEPLKIQGNENSFLFIIDDTTPASKTQTISALRYLSGSVGTATIKVADNSLYSVVSQSTNNDYQDAVVKCPAQALNNTYSVLIAESNTGVKSYAYLYTILKNNGNTVTFEYNNGEPITIQNLVNGKITSLPTPTKKVGGIEYVFNGWMTANGRFIDTDEYFVSSIVLYASWSKPATFDGRDFLILQEMTSDYDQYHPENSHSRIQKQFNLGTITQMSDLFQISCSSTAIPTESAERTFAIDTGISQSITISFSRKSPLTSDDTNEDSDKWSNRKWITELRKLINRYQAFTDGLKLAYIPGDCKRYTIAGRNYYFGKYMRMLGSIHDNPNFTVNAKSDLTSLTSAKVGDTAYTSSDKKWYLCNGTPTTLSNWIENTDNQIGQSTDRLGIGYKYKNAEGEEHWYLGINCYASSLTTTYSEGTTTIIEGSIKLEIGGIMENYRDDMGWN